MSFPPPPIEPTAGSPARPAGSVRRTSAVDILWPTDDLSGLRLVGTGRDLRTAADGAGAVVDEQTVDASTGADRALLGLEARPPVAGLHRLLGARVGSGFRRAVEGALGDEVVDGSLLNLLLDDLPVAALISGYALVRTRTDFPGPASPGARSRMVDICSGWRADGLLVRSMGGGRGVPVGVAPPAPALERPGDPLSWHRLDPLPPGSMRRRRRIDLAGDGSDGATVDAMFRDSYFDPGDGEVVLHEYTLQVTLDASGVVSSARATPRVLPMPECPAAADSAGLLVGLAAGELRRTVRERITGTISCTHLNDLFRALGDLPYLAGVLAAPPVGA